MRSSGRSGRPQACVLEVGLAGPVRALPGERRVLEHHRTPNPAKPTGLLGPRVAGTGGALAGPVTEHRCRSLFRIASSFKEWGLILGTASMTLHWARGADGTNLVT